MKLNPNNLNNKSIDINILIGAVTILGPIKNKNPIFSQSTSIKDKISPSSFPLLEILLCNIFSYINPVISFVICSLNNMFLNSKWLNNKVFNIFVIIKRIELKNISKQ